MRRIVGKRELIKSLHTRDPHTACIRATYFYSTVVKINNVLQMKELTDAQIEEAVQRTWDRIGSSQKARLSDKELETIVLNAWSRVESVLKAPFSESELDRLFCLGADDDLDYWSEEVSGLNDQFDQVSGRFHSSPSSVEEVLSKYNLNHKDYHREDCERLYQELKRVEFDSARKFYTKYKNWENDLHTPSSRIVSNQQAASEPSSIKFSELYKRFIEYKVRNKALKEDMQSEYQRYYDTFIDLEGDLPIASIKRLVIKEFIMEKFRYLPRRSLGPYRGKSPTELLAMEIPEEHMISDKTAKECFKFLQGMFAFAADKELIESSPALSVKLELNLSGSYGAYTKSQIRTFLRAVENLQGWKYWIVLLGIYTGARLGELCQLRAQDVLQDEECNRWYIRITDEAGSVKNPNAKRRVPLHKELLKAGFLEFVKESDQVLFPNLQSQVATQWFRSFRKEIGVPDLDEHGHKLVFHSFRHTFITTARSSGNISLRVIQDFVGHEKMKGENETDTYTGSFPISTLCKVVDVIDYSESNKKDPDGMVFQLL